jgi:hypothetical protein
MCTLILIDIEHFYFGRILILKVLSTGLVNYFMNLKTFLGTDRFNFNEIIAVKKLTENVSYFLQIDLEIAKFSIHFLWYLMAV